jgi:hypothetical protein
MNTQDLVSHATNYALRYTSDKGWFARTRVNMPSTGPWFSVDMFDHETKLYFIADVLIEERPGSASLASAYKRSGYEGIMNAVVIAIDIARDSHDRMAKTGLYEVK